MTYLPEHTLISLNNTKHFRDAVRRSISEICLFKNESDFTINALGLHAVMVWKNTMKLR